MVIKFDYTMKNIKFIAMIGAMGLAFAACEPTLIDGPEPYAPVESTVLADGITYTQYADKECTQQDPNGNFVKFSSAAGVVQVMVEGTTNVIFTGAGGVIKLPAKRGQEPKMNLVFRIANADGTFTEATRTFNCTPPTELSPEMLMLVSDNGKKVWKYAQDGIETWGNAGYTAEAGAQFTSPDAVGNKWWGVADTETMLDQIGGPAKEACGDEDMSAYMVFTEDGEVTTYSPTGNAVRSGGFEVLEYNADRANGWSLGTLKTTEPAILFPWDCAGGGAVSEFDIMYLSPQHMTLLYVPAGTADWGTMTYWRFVAGTPDPLTMEGTWTYGANGYGNGGHSGAGAAFNAPGVVDGNWWGVASGDELADQTHISGGVFGDESSEAYMVFEGNTVTTYAPDGTKIRGGEWSAVMNDFASGAGRGAAGWELGKLTTSEPALLFPWNINGEGDGVTEYDIMYYDANNITLIYTDGAAAGGWDAAITHWVFVRK